MQERSWDSFIHEFWDGETDSEARFLQCYTAVAQKLQPQPPDYAKKLMYSVQQMKWQIKAKVPCYIAVGPQSEGITFIIM